MAFLITVPGLESGLAERGEIRWTRRHLKRRRNQQLGKFRRPRRARHQNPWGSRVPAIIVGVVIAAIAGLSIWYLVRPAPLLVQGEIDATRFDIAARVDGRVAEIPVVRGQNVAAGAVLVKIDNPETVAKRAQSIAARVVAEAQLANIRVGTRAEVIAARKAAQERAEFERGAGAKDL